VCSERYCVTEGQSDWHRIYDINTLTEFDIL
jgi:hypothetical protein